MNFSFWMNRAPLLGITLLMVLGFCSPANAGQWVVDRYEYAGKSHSEGLSCTPHTEYVNGSRQPDGSYDIVVKAGSVIARDGKTLSEKGQVLSESSRDDVRRASIGWENIASSDPNSDTHKRHEKTDPISIQASIDWTVTAVLKWQRGRIYNPATNLYVEDAADDPRSLYVRETASGSAYKTIYGNSDGRYNQDNPWSGDYLKISGSLGPFDESSGSSSANSNGASVIYSCPSKVKIYQFRDPQEEFRVPSYTFRAQLEMKPGYEKERAGSQGGAWLDYGYRVEPLEVSFSLSTSPSGVSTGAYPNPLHWDGLTMTTDPTQIDPTTGQPIQRPAYTRIAPNEKNYYLVIQGTVTLFNETTPPATVSVKAQRIRSVGQSASVPLLLVSQSAQGKPTPNAGGTTTYTYRTHDLDDDEASPRRVKGTNDWHINDKLGRWQFEMEEWPSNKVEFKIDKRSQIIGRASDYAAYEEYFPKGSAGYNACDGFVDTHIYGRLGLPTIGLNALSGVTDDGAGALRFFQNKSYEALETPPFTSASHVAIQGASVFYGRTQIDNNWLNSGIGPTVRGFDQGVGFPWDPSAFYWNNAISRAPAGTIAGLSILQELDLE